MTQALIQKNIKLSLDFDRYITKHPSELKSLKGGVSVLITTASDKKLSETNLSIAKSSRGGRFVVAHKSGKGWKITALKK